MEDLNFCVIQASEQASSTALPGTSKWISTEMSEFSSLVCLQSKSFEESVYNNLNWLNDQVNEIIYFDDNFDSNNDLASKMTLLLKSPKKSPVRLEDQRIGLDESNEENGTQKQLHPVHLDFNKKPELTTTTRSTSIDLEKYVANQ